MPCWAKPGCDALLTAALYLKINLKDDHDLGVGLLLLKATDAEKDTMIASIGPFWDANETWLVLGVGVLLIAFPMAHGVVLQALYLPVAVMLGHALQKPKAWIAPGLGQAVINTLVVGAVAAVLTVAGATFLIQALRLSRRSLARVILPLTSLGYAAPGAVLAVGILIPLAAFDHKMADAIVAVTGHDPGLLLTGTAAALVLAYTVRFFGIAQGAVEAAFGRVAPTLPMAARSLGQTAGGVLRRIYLPLMRGSVSTALLMVFVDCVKELPATLMLRPFNFNTLSTRAYDLASLEKITEAAPAALLVIAFSLTAVAIMARSSRA